MELNNEFINESTKEVEKWGKLGFLEGITDDHTRRVTAILMENQRLLNLKLNENGTTTSDVDSFRRITIPLVRRIFPNLIANKLVGIQPLLGPTGLVFYLRFRYTSDKGSVLGNTDLSGFPNDDHLSMGQTASGDTNVHEYYTHPFVENETSATDAGGDTTSEFQLLHTPVTPGSVIGTVYDGDEAIQTFAVGETGSFVFTDLGTPSTKAISAGSEIDLVTGDVKLAWNNDPGDNYVVFSYQYNIECNTDLSELNLTVERETITAMPRKLKAVWSQESEQDLRSQHSLDAQKELTQVMATQINLEIDREIINDLRQRAGTNATWDYSTAIGDTIKERYESLYIKVTEVSNIIFRKTLRGQANWIVTSPEVSSIFETSVAGFVPNIDGFTGTAGVQYAGNVKGRWNIYKDPQFPRNQILLGLKGDSYMDAGYFYCPYVPLQATPTVYDPESFCKRIGMMTRYGKKMLREGAKFYATINISSFNI